MPYDVFISYSRRDSVDALALAERLQAENLSVWIDQHGITGAEHWSSEIVESISNCATFLLLLSPNSIDSENVLRELMLAVDRHKRILPVSLKQTRLPSAFDYAIAGIQQVPYFDLAAIMRAHAHGAERIAARSGRLSLMVMPFEDLSPEQDNGWFADGLTGELISTLSMLKSVRIVDRKTAMSFKHYTGRTVTLAQELDVQYFLEGSVRKAGDEIKINVELLNIGNGEYLWQYSQRGTMHDIFDVQEAVAQKVVEGLKLHLTGVERRQMDERQTHNSDAYALAMRAEEFFHKHTKGGLEYAIALYREAIEIDPYYTHAIQAMAFMLADYYRVYDRDPKHLEEAEALAMRVIERNNKEPLAHRALCMIYRLQGKNDLAEEEALRFRRRAPENYTSHFTLGLHYASTNRPELAVGPYEEALKIKPDDLDTHWNLAIVHQRCQNQGSMAKTASNALEHYNKWIRLHPDDESRRVQLATLLDMAGRRDEALATLKPLEGATDLDPTSLYNIACLSCNLGDHPAALRYLNRAVDEGFRNLEVLSHDPDLQPLRGLPEFTAIEEKVRTPIEKVGG